jgi:WhiB family redox-sensing transcriptional regulator
VVTTQGWVDQAACAGADPELWFDSNPDGPASRLALQICAGCPVRTDCLNYALEFGVTHGIFGGLLPRQRRTYRRNNKIRTQRAYRYRLPCGTSAGYKRHQRAGQVPCPACVRAEQQRVHKKQERGAQARSAVREQVTA